MNLSIIIIIIIIVVSFHWLKRISVWNLGIIRVVSSHHETNQDSRGIGMQRSRWLKSTFDCWRWYCFEVQTRPIFFNNWCVGSRWITRHLTILETRIAFEPSTMSIRVSRIVYVRALTTKFKIMIRIYVYTYIHTYIYFKVQTIFQTLISLSRIFLFNPSWKCVKKSRIFSYLNSFSSLYSYFSNCFILIFLYWFYFSFWFSCYIYYFCFWSLVFLFFVWIFVFRLDFCLAMSIHSAIRMMYKIQLLHGERWVYVDNLVAVGEKRMAGPWTVEESWFSIWMLQVIRF